MAIYDQDFSGISRLLDHLTPWRGDCSTLELNQFQLQGVMTQLFYLRLYQGYAKCGRNQNLEGPILGPLFYAQKSSGIRIKCDFCNPLDAKRFAAAFPEISFVYTHCELPFDKGNTIRLGRICYQRSETLFAFPEEIDNRNRRNGFPFLCPERSL